jgi:hypothetical protein
MPEQSVIVWDLETVLDLSAAARMLDLGDACSAVLFSREIAFLVTRFDVDQRRRVRSCGWDYEPRLAAWDAVVSSL